ncbi:hypothetical protein D3C72_2425080 [compost metagenome]
MRLTTFCCVASNADSVTSKSAPSGAYLTPTSFSVPVVGFSGVLARVSTGRNEVE